MPVRLWSAFLARDERGLIGARNDRPDKKTNDVRQRPAQVAVAARSRTSWPGGSPQRLDVAPNDLALVARRAAAVCVPPLAGARSFAICPNSNTECEYGNCGETGDQHYKCDCIVFEPTQTFCKHHVLSSAGLRQIAGKGSSQSIYLTIYRRQRIRLLYQCNLGRLPVIYRLIYRLNDNFRSRLLVVGKVKSYPRVLRAIHRTMVSKSTSTTPTKGTGARVPQVGKSKEVAATR
jgi:hypothetical protein